MYTVYNIFNLFAKQKILNAEIRVM